MNYISKNIGIKNIKTGKNVVIYNPSNVYDCKLDDNVFVGPFVEIQKGVKIGKNSKIQSHVFICEKVVIGENCFVSHGSVFINDKFRDKKRAMGDKTKWKETNVQNNVLIGSNCTILPVSICSNVVIGAGSVVTKNIVEKGVYAGNPAKKIYD